MKINYYLVSYICRFFCWSENFNFTTQILYFLIPRICLKNCATNIKSKKRISLSWLFLIFDENTHSAMIYFTVFVLGI